MRIPSPFPRKKARIEIIPLIDIMFFLLASFMMASLAMIRLQSMEMSLPTATVASSKKKDMIDVNVMRNGDLVVDKVPMNYVDFSRLLSNRFEANTTNLQVYIKGDDEATHGRVIEVLDIVRQHGIKNVSFALNPPTKKK